MKLLYTLIILSAFSFAVGEAGAIFLTIHPNGYNNAIGGTGVSSSSNYIPFYNPASPLINRGLNVEISEGFCEWLPNLTDDMKTKNNQAIISYGTSELINNYFIQFSISKSFFNLRKEPDYNKPLNHSDDMMNLTSNSLSYSIGIKSQQHPIFFSIGRTNKDLTQHITNYTYHYYFSKNKVFDWGFLLSIENEFRNNYNIISTIGYSKSNIADEFVSDYRNYETSIDPLPRNSRVGISFVFEKILHNQKKISVTLLMEAEDILVERVRNDDGSFIEDTYLNSYLGDIDLIDNVLLGNSNDTDGVIINRGIDINYNDVVNIGFGKIIDKAGHVDVKSRGCEVSLLKLIYLNSLNLKNIDLNWIFSYDGGEQGHPRANTMHHQLKLTINNL